MNDGHSEAQRQSNAVTTQQHAQFGLHAKTSILLLTALLLAVIAVSGLTIKLMQSQRAVLDDAIKKSRAQSMALLANQVDQTLLATLRPPFLELKNIPPHKVTIRRFLRLKESTPELEKVLFLNADMQLKYSFPRPRSTNDQDMNEWLAKRTSLEGVNNNDGYVLHTFVETLDGHPTLFALQRVSEIDPSAGWILMLFDLDLIKERRVAPLVGEFRANQGGAVQLHDPETRWDDAALNWPVGRVLPGWMLVLNPETTTEAQGMRWSRAVMLAIAAGVILTMVMATFAAWRELRREHALVELRNRFIANVSHELKTPLALIRMYAETLYLRRITDNDRQHEYHRVLLRESERLSQMINTVLDFSRLSQGVSLYQLNETDLRATVSGILDDYSGRFDAQGLHLKVLVEDEIPPVAHDRHGVMQILLNLIDNAVKYGAGEGVIEIMLCAVKEGVELIVIDHGPGIPQEEREQMRKPFQRGRDTDPASGAGLGLALVDEIAKIHHAKFILDAPDEGSGVKAIIRFPLGKTTP